MYRTMTLCEFSGVAAAGDPRWQTDGPLADCPFLGAIIRHMKLPSLPSACWTIIRRASAVWDAVRSLTKWLPEPRSMKLRDQ